MTQNWQKKKEKKKRFKTFYKKQKLRVSIVLLKQNFEKITIITSDECVFFNSIFTLREYNYWLNRKTTGLESQLDMIIKKIKH